MSVPDWWGSRRFGVFVHSNLATVPSWAPIGEYSDWYRSHLGEPVADVLLHPAPMVEVLAHHRDRWDHVDGYDDFWPLLTYDRFDPDAWAGLAVDAGAAYTVFVTKHHDGLCWWDAPNTDRTVLHDGPRRNVLAEYATACERAGLTFGTYYSLLDWSDARYPDRAYVDEVLHPHVTDLVERYGSRILWGDGHWGHGPDRWRCDQLLDRLRSDHPDLVVNDRWWADAPDVRTFEYEVPDVPPSGEWELCRGLGHSFCHNRAERAEHLLTGAEIIALLTEVVAKGGHLLLNVGPAADGTIPDLQSAPLRAAGHWITRHADLVHRARPWDVWGDADVRYLRSAAPPTEDRPPLVLDLVDVSGHGRFAALASDRGRVRRVVRLVDGGDTGIEPLWEQDGAGLSIRPLAGGSTVAGRDGPTVHRVEFEPIDVVAPTLFPPVERAPIPLAPLLAQARRGDVVQLGDGVHAGPATVPDGVTVRGLGRRRTRIVADGPTAIVLGAGSRLEHLSAEVTDERVAWFPVPVVRIVGARSLLLDCTVDGHVVIEGDESGPVHHVRIRACRATGVVAREVETLTVSRSRFRGNRWDVGVDIEGGSGHVIESCDLHDHLSAVRVVGTTAASVRGNVIEARWWGVRAVDTDSTTVTGNSMVRTMRAVDVDGGRSVEVAGNAVADGDSGCIVQRGAVGTVVAGNHWERCRIGLLAWDALDVVHHDNVAVDLHDPDAAVQVGPV